MNGVETGRAVLEVQPRVRIVVYTGLEDQRWLPELVDLGIMGHVRKSEPPGVLLRAIESVRRGEIFVTFPDPGGAWPPCCSERLRRRRAVGDAAADLRALSPREKQIFRLLADGQKRQGHCWRAVHQPQNSGNP